jgi:hypothetical protein
MGADILFPHISNVDLSIHTHIQYFCTPHLRQHFAGFVCYAPFTLHSSSLSGSSGIMKQEVMKSRSTYIIS